MLTKPAALLTTVLLFVVALGHVLRMLLGIGITVAGIVVPMWVSVAGTVVPAALAVALWRESRSA